MLERLRHRLPEFALGAILLFFSFRELGTFPSPWNDDSLFMIVAKELAAGRGYVLPVLDEGWRYPFILNVGPQVIVPAAIMIKLFGYAASIARLPSVVILILTSLVSYLYTKKTVGRNAARWATALLVTLSAFINTGKPVLGEVPGFLFLLLGLYVLHGADRTQREHTFLRLPRSIAVGLLFGIAVMTKLTYGLIYPAIGAAFLAAACRRDWRETRDTAVMGIAAAAAFLPWRLLESAHRAGFSGELGQYAVGWDALPYLNVIRAKPELLLRLPFLAFGLLFVLGGAGLWLRRRTFTPTEHAIILTLVALFMVYFLNGFGWYRHLLPAHLLLLPFVPDGAGVLLKRKLAAALLGAVVLAQFFYQLDHRGAGTVTVTGESADILERDFRGTELVVQEPAIFVELPENPRWTFLSTELEARRYGEFENLPLAQEEHCLPVVRQTPANRAGIYGEERLTKLAGSYYLIGPPASCSR